MNQYEFMKNWCEVQNLEPELHWPAAQRAWDVAREQPVDLHAALKAQYEEDCKYSDEPWQWWEHKPDNLSKWKPCRFGDPLWNPVTTYRRKADAPEWLPEPEPLTEEEWEAHADLSKERRNGFYSEKGMLCSYYGRVLATIDKGWTVRDPEDTGSNAERQEFFRWLKDWRTQRISGSGSPESTKRESGGTHQSPGSLEHLLEILDDCRDYLDEWMSDRHWYENSPRRVYQMEYTAAKELLENVDAVLEGKNDG